MIKDKKLEKIDFIDHAFFTRKNGISSGIYKSLNCGYGSDDSEENIKNNIKIVLDKIKCENHLCNLYQIHSNKVLHLTKAWKYPNLPKADAIVTDKKNIAIGILTADCVPVLFCDTNAKIIAAAHAGWKGTANGIIQNTIIKMIKLGAERNNIVASIGPAIQQKSYEVDSNFKDNFQKSVFDSEKYFINSSNENLYLFDLPTCVENILLNCKIGNVSNLKIDTYSNKEDFFSYRRAVHYNEIDYGRQISVITLIR